MIDQFEALLIDLGKILGISLAPDRFGACSIEIAPLTVQLEPDEKGEHLILFSTIVELPPGKFRENVLQEALKTNGEKEPRPGVLGYVAPKNLLSLHQRYPLRILTAEILSGILGGFLEMAESWFEAVNTGRSSPNPPSDTPPPFGMKI